MAEPVLEIDRLSKRYGSVLAAVRGVMPVILVEMHVAGGTAQFSRATTRWYSGSRACESH